MPQAEHKVRDMDLEDTVVRDGGGPKEEKGCLELLLILWLPAIITIILGVTHGR